MGFNLCVLVQFVGVDLAELQEDAQVLLPTLSYYDVLYDNF